MKKQSIVSIFICCIIAVFCLVGCENNNDTADKNKHPTTIALNLDNYSEYFILQEEVVSYSEETYKSNNFLCARANQTTKFSIIQLKENIKFNNVIITLENDTYTGSRYLDGSKAYWWKGSGGQLRLAYDGSGFTTLKATYNDYADKLERNPMQYKISKIDGTITIN